MTVEEKIEAIIDQVSELPARAQVDLVETLLQMRAQQLGMYEFDDDDRASLAQSAEDMRLGRYASDTEVSETFARYGA